MQIAVVASQCPTVIKHDFPNEQQNYLDEKVEEGQYKKRFRFDQTSNPIQKKRRPKTVQQPSVINMNSGDLYKKLINTKKNTKEERFVVKPQKKLNVISLHQALYKVKKQQEKLDSRIKIAELSKQYYVENDICMVANQGAIQYLLKKSQEQQEDNKHSFIEDDVNQDTENILGTITSDQNQIKSQIHPSRIKSAVTRPDLPQEIIKNLQFKNDFLEVEGKGYHFSLSQNSRLRPFSAISTMQPMSSQQNWDQLQEQFVGLRNLLINAIDGGARTFQDDPDRLLMGIQNENKYLSPSASEQYYPIKKGMRGCKVGQNFMKNSRGLVQRTASAVVTFQPFLQKDEQPPSSSASRKQRIGVKGSRPQSAYIFFGGAKRPNLANKIDHLKVIEEIQRQNTSNMKKQSILQRSLQERDTIQIMGNTLNKFTILRDFPENSQDFPSSQRRIQRRPFSSMVTLNNKLQAYNTNNQKNIEDTQSWYAN